jgi:diadenosine tetraphosphate (Ap4A) HIT family hydrolase
MTETCLACEVNAGRLPAPGGVILDTGRWVVDHTIGTLGVGTIIVKPSRHVVRVGELDDDEAVELGPLLQRVAAAVDVVARPSQVYVSLWSHQDRRPGHIHFVVQPVSEELMAELDAHGPRLQAALFDRAQPPDAEDAAGFAARVRALLAPS